MKTDNNWYGDSPLASVMDLSPDKVETLSGYIELIHEWNAFASLVSHGDLQKGLQMHLADSLSLVPWVLKVCGREGCLLDIGSGAGFPAIPVKVACPQYGMILVERSERKVAFLRKVVAALGIIGVDIRHGTFPQCVAGERPNVVTARAVERPQKVLKDILEFIPSGCAFLHQSGDFPDNLAPLFHVEHVQDEWTRLGLRRGPLSIVKRATPDSRLSG